MIKLLCLWNWEVDIRLDNPEVTFDAIGIADTDLNVAFLEETGSVIDTLSFKEQSTHGIESWFAGTFIKLMNRIDYGTVKPTQQSTVLRQRKFRRLA